MKLIVQIPCYNEADTLPQTLAEIPRQFEGISSVEILIIDDGSTDDTVNVARQHGVERIICNKENIGLAKTFSRGMDACLKAGADIIVNTDGDNQYHGEDIARLIAPILKHEADIVVGDRQTDNIEHFSARKKFLQKLGSRVVRRLSKLEVPDAVSGFRAFSRDAAIKLNVLSSFSYTIEILIQAGKRNLAVTSVPVRTNSKTRESRLSKSIFSFIGRQVTTIIRVYAMYQPLKVFFYLGMTLSAIGILPIFRFLYFYLTSGGSGHVQSLVLGSVLLLMGFITFLFGLIADLISNNRQLNEQALEKIKRIELEQIQRKSTASK
ncbi:MAG: glycosyltransferase family 2 protein [Gammaproteobacteria bacterium]|nr:glycosyltransferase family 2 protein [Gammaproteobacteria bacterium]